jgi:hypothetical protein
VYLLELRSATHTSCSISGSAERTVVVKRERNNEREKQGKEEQGFSMVIGFTKMNVLFLVLFFLSKLVVGKLGLIALVFILYTNMSLYYSAIVLGIST